MHIIKSLYEKFLPIYFQFWSNYWFAAWSAPDLKKETHWQALRITIRKGKHHSRVLVVIKQGTGW